MEMSMVNSLPKKLWFAPLCGALIAILVADSLTTDMQYTVGVTVWVALWWVFEVVPIPVASMLPFVLFPMGGILSKRYCSVLWALANYFVDGWFHALDND